MSDTFDSLIRSSASAGMKQMLEKSREETRETGSYGLGLLKYYQDNPDKLEEDMAAYYRRTGQDEKADQAIYDLDQMEMGTPGYTDE
tara:strand:- start:186 stop:446 length:261 start_codon:yes stop_codon:yes gene_type:complete